MRPPRIPHPSLVNPGAKEQLRGCFLPPALGTAMNKLLFADSAGPAWQKVYSNSHYALAALLPASLVSPQDGAIAKVADVGLAAAITAHNHIALNYGARGGRRLGSIGAAGAGCRLQKAFRATLSHRSCY